MELPAEKDGPLLADFDLATHATLVARVKAGELQSVPDHCQALQWAFSSGRYPGRTQRRHRPRHIDPDAPFGTQEEDAPAGDHRRRNGRLPRAG